MSVLRVYKGGLQRWQCSSLSSHTLDRSGLHSFQGGLVTFEFMHYMKCITLNDSILQRQKEKLKETIDSEFKFSGVSLIMTQAETEMLAVLMKLLSHLHSNCPGKLNSRRR